jgi:phospholipid-translocating ATPase
LAFRIVPGRIYKPWAERFRAAQALIKDREVEIDKIADEIERGFSLMGATAIEDKLQDGVPESISVLSKAGIKIWVLTV